MPIPAENSENRGYNEVRQKERSLWRINSFLRAERGCCGDTANHQISNEGAVKLGYFHNGHFPPIDFEDFVRWGAANGYQVIDVPLFQPDARAICERHGLEPTSTTGMVCQPIATDAAARTEAVAEARRALDYAAAEQISIAWLGHQMAPDLGFDANVRLFADGVAPVLDHAQRVGVRLVMENWADGGRNLAYAPAHWEAIFDAVPHEALGLCFDPSHLAWLGIDYLRAAREFGARIYHAHAEGHRVPAGGTVPVRRDRRRARKDRPGNVPLSDSGIRRNRLARLYHHAAGDRLHRPAGRRARGPVLELHCGPTPSARSRGWLLAQRFLAPLLV